MVLISSVPNLCILFTFNDVLKELTSDVCLMFAGKEFRCFRLLYSRTFRCIILTNDHLLTDLSLYELHEPFGEEVDRTSWALSTDKNIREVSNHFKVWIFIIIPEIKNHNRAINTNVKRFPLLISHFLHRYI